MSMDRQIEKKFWTPKRIAFWSGIAVGVAVLLYLLLSVGSGSRLNVEKDKLTISTVHEGSFQDFIPVEGTVTPVNTVYLDAIEGGVIKRIFRESGAMVNPGDTILTLSNSSMQLNTMYQESQLYDQINNVRNTRINLQQTSLNLRNAMVDARYGLEIALAQFNRDSTLYSKGAITLSNKDFADDKASYQRSLEKWKIARAAYRQDSLLHQTRMKQLDQSEMRLNKSLNYLEKILNNLVVTAPIKGQLTTPDLETGQSVSVGQRLGQVDILNNYEARVDIDEHYLSRVDTGLVGSFDFNNNTYDLKITKVYPSVSNGQFQVDMAFKGSSPAGLRPGQTLQIHLALGASSKALLLARGGFYQTSGGNWAYVLDPSGDYARKRNIQIGRQNTDYFEVLSGLKPGEKVITSSYDNFGDNDVLVLK